MYNSVKRLAVCRAPTLFQVSLSRPVEGVRDVTGVRACTIGDGLDAHDTFRSAPDALSSTYDASRIAKRDGNGGSDSTCGPSAQSSAHLQLGHWGTREDSSDSFRNSLFLLDEITKWTSGQDGCASGSTVLFGHLNGTFLGYFGGSRIHDGKTLGEFVDAVSIPANSGDGLFDRSIVQHCGSTSRANLNLSSEAVGNDKTHIAGLALARGGDFASVHQAVRSWNSASCVQNHDAASFVDIANSKIHLHPAPEPAASASMRTASLLSSDGQCRSIRIEKDNLCDDLAKRCGISLSDYKRYNSGTNHCGTLKAGELVCCSEGEVAPQPEADGTCASYVTQAEDDCYKIGQANGIKEKDIEDFNKNTWGWTGCGNLDIGVRICVSKGKAAMPAPVAGVDCGPTKPGSRAPRGDQKLEDLNPCPLNVCCNVWGRCGLNDDFCTVKKSSTGAPGTSGAKNGCIQNCGREIVNNDKAPSEFRKLGYFEGWNFGRKCLHMDVQRAMDHPQKYTDIHFSFGEISDSLDPYIPKNTTEQWEKFLKIKGGPRRILAFGGWAFSTEDATYQRFPLATNPANRAAFARKVVDFAVANGLDGLDFDWEYPAAPDIGGRPPQPIEEGANYLAFLQEVRNILPLGMTLSIAAPASYWYLKAFPIARMAPLLDYIVYMTYDLHGQWDADNHWSSPGCDNGNCLRSHVNHTETEAALVMITKAGVPAHKVLVGVATYGRSFKIAESTCYGPDCTFEGTSDESPAAKGECTDTGGYLSLAEINKILSEDPTARTWIDTSSGSNSNVMVYQYDEWVAYMDDNIRQTREGLAKRRNFGGTIEWAVDLQEFLDEGGVKPIPAEKCDWRKVVCTHPSLVDSGNKTRRWADSCATAAWEEALTGWKYNQSQKINPTFTFVHGISNFFNHGDGMDCHLMKDENGCTGRELSCIEDRGQNRPASWMIMNSIIKMDNVLWNMYSAMKYLKTTVALKMDDFDSKFMTPKKDTSHLSTAVVLDILTMGFATVMAPAWNKVLKPRFGSSNGWFDTAKDATNDLVYTGVSLAKDVIADEGGAVDDIQSTNDFVDRTLDRWMDGVKKYADYLFNKNMEGIELLGKLMSGGVLDQTNITGVMDESDLVAKYTTALYTILIPTAWKYAPADFNPL
ncbi:Killer toxin subunits alpha/beta 6 [Colletotrichum sojae]|uniref:chitinase n=1 Tax=Colletotrichum sojae TaxID=2175907 RepID=A0A8H6MNV3_9PEZI|nr:Killer toxin subunits alpha/beta 6 [Colletotrichum sojae]